VSGSGRGSRGRSSNRGGARGRGRGGVVAVQGGVPTLRSHPAATTSTLMKSMHGRRRTWAASVALW
jgi:hypothetical protein